MVEVKVILLMFLGFVALCVVARGLIELLFPKSQSSKSNPINAPSDALNRQNRNNTDEEPYDTRLSDSVNELDKKIDYKNEPTKTQKP